jgi:hypothetical protein
VKESEVTIPGYELKWQVRDHLLALKRERGTAVPGKEIIIDREIERFQKELDRLNAAELAEIKARYAAEEAAAKAAAGL